MITTFPVDIFFINIFFCENHVIFQYMNKIEYKDSEKNDMSYDAIQ